MKRLLRRISIDTAIMGCMFVAFVGVIYALAMAHAAIEEFLP